LTKILKFGSVDRRVGSGRRRSTRNVIVQQLLVSGGIVFAAHIKASDVHFE